MRYNESVELSVGIPAFFGWLWFALVDLFAEVGASPVGDG